MFLKIFTINNRIKLNLIYSWSSDTSNLRKENRITKDKYFINKEHCYFQSC
jgi:hypothetical protein